MSSPTKKSSTKPINNKTPRGWLPTTPARNKPHNASPYSRSTTPESATQPPSPAFKKLRRPSAIWRAEREKEAARVASRHLDPVDAYAYSLYPDAFLNPLHHMLGEFEADVKAAVSTAPDLHIMSIYVCIKRLVLALNGLEKWIKGDEREALIEYISNVVKHAGVSLDDMEDEFGEDEVVVDKWAKW